jgi:hypothetical protein
VISKSRKVSGASRKSLTSKFNGRFIEVLAQAAGLAEYIYFVDPVSK